jgi:RNA polymerase sigma factor (sigma-70 family)
LAGHDKTDADFVGIVPCRGDISLLASAYMDQVTRDMLLAQDGDDAAFARLVATTEPDVRRFCTWFTRPVHDIDDLVQETFLRAFRGLNSFSGRSTATAWLLTIARRVCLDLAERRRRDESITTELSSLTGISSSVGYVGDLGADVVGALLLEELPEPFRPGQNPRLRL